MYCKKCNKEFSETEVTKHEDEIYCPVCGYRIIIGDTKSNQDEEEVIEILPKRKKNIGCGIILLIMSLGALKSAVGNSAGEPARLLGGLVAFFLFVYFGIRMIRGKEVK